MDDPSLDVRVQASATLCNIVLDFSPMKKLVLLNGGVDAFVKLLHSNCEELRITGVWGLKNLLYNSNEALKREIMEKLTFDLLFRLIEDSNVEIQIQALNLLRNLAFQSTDFVMQHAESLLRVLARKLDPNAPNEVLQHAVSVLVNVASGEEQHKDFLMRPTLLHKLYTLLVSTVLIVKPIYY